VLYGRHGLFSTSPAACLSPVLPFAISRTTAVRTSFTPLPETAESTSGTVELRQNGQVVGSERVTLANPVAGYSNQDVLVRFRVGADDSTGAPGWDVDDIAVTGITNTPFTALVPNAGVCGP